MLLEGEKPNYSRETVEDHIYSLEYKFKEYGELSVDDLDTWLSKVKRVSESLHHPLQIEVDIYEESNGFDYGSTYVHLTPFYKRLETDDEYNKRIAEEEKEYRDNLERERLRKEEHEQYTKDYEEYQRLKNKYHF